jgi:hypothetical protein
MSGVIVHILGWRANWASVSEPGAKAALREHLIGWARVRGLTVVVDDAGTCSD